MVPSDSLERVPELQDLVFVGRLFQILRCLLALESKSVPLLRSVREKVSIGTHSI